MVNPAKDDEAEKLLKMQSRQAGIIEKDIDDFIIASLQHRQGREFLWWLLGVARIGQQPFTHNALVTSFQCGEMNVGLQLQARILRVNAAGYVQMMKERSDDQYRHDDDGGIDSADDA